MDRYTRMLSDQFYGSDVAKMLKKKDDYMLIRRSRTRSVDVQRFSISCQNKSPFRGNTSSMKSRASETTSLSHAHIPQKPNTSPRQPSAERVLKMAIWETPQILECLLKFMSVEHLQTCRLVNQAWNRASCVHLRQRSFVNLVGKLKMRANQGKQTTCQELEEFWRVLHLNKVHRFPSPFKNFAISIELIEDATINEKIISDPSKEITILDYSIDENITFNLNYFNSLRKILSKNANCLETLKYTFSYLGSQSSSSSLSKQRQRTAVTSRSRSLPFSRMSSWSRSATDNGCGDTLEEKILKGNRNGFQFQFEFENLTKLKCPKLNLNLPALTQFDFFSWSYGSIYDEPSFMKFLSNILKGAPNLQNFSTNTDDFRVLNYLLNKNLLRNLRDIYLKKVCSGSLRCLMEAEFPKLKSIGLNLWKFDTRLETYEFGELIQKLAPNVTEISISRISTTSSNSTKTFPVCPKLEKILLCDASGNLGILNAELMPNLKSVWIANFELNANSKGDSNSENKKERGRQEEESKSRCKSSASFDCQCFEELDAAEPHVGVEEIHFKCRFGSHVDPSPSSPKTMETTGAIKRRNSSKMNMNYGRANVKFLSFLSQQFPNVKTFHLNMSTFSKSLVLAIIRFYPNLENLVLESLGPGNSIPEEIFTGAEKRLLDLYMEGQSYGKDGRPTNFEEIKSISLSSMKRLKYLNIVGFHEFGRSLDYLTNTAIHYGVAGIPSLEAFHFDWHEDLYPDVIGRNLSHLSEIVVRFKKGVPVKEDVLQSLKQFPQIRIKYVSASESDLHDDGYIVNKFDFKNY